MNDKFPSMEEILDVLKNKCQEEKTIKVMIFEKDFETESIKHFISIIPQLEKELGKPIEITIKENIEKEYELKLNPVIKSNFDIEECNVQNHNYDQYKKNSFKEVNKRNQFYLKRNKRK